MEADQVDPAKVVEIHRRGSRRAYFYLRRTSDGMFFRFPASRYSGSPSWVDFPEANGWGYRWAARWVAGMYGLTVKE